MLKVFKYVGVYRKYLIGSTLLVMMGAVFGIIPYFLLNDLLVAYLTGAGIGMTALAHTSILIGVCFICRAVLNGIGLSASHYGAFGTLLNIRHKFSKNMTRHPMGTIIETGTGTYKKGFTEDVELLEVVLAHVIPEGLPSLFMSIFGILVVFFLDWRLGLLSLAPVFISLIPLQIIMKKGLATMPSYFKAKDQLNAAIVEYVSGMEVVKIFNHTQGSYKKFVDITRQFYTITLGWMKSMWMPMAVTSAVLPTTILFSLPLGTVFYLNGSLPLEKFYLTLMISLGLGAHISKALNFMHGFPKLNYAMEKLESVFVRDRVQCGHRTEMPDNFHVRFENVSFAYEKEDVIKNLSLDMKQNTLTALVGESGSGKSTLAKLLVHYWDVNKGAITIGGVDIREFTMETLMSMTSYVAQDTFLFDTTIRENIAMGKPGADGEAVIAAAKSAACHEFIMGLDNGYDTKAGALTGKLSGGEKQRITIARAILKDAPIVILDEATAFADPENEDLIQQALAAVLRNKTAIVIAHRLNSIVDADNIVVLKQGEIASTGNQKKLLEASGIYRKLWARSEQANAWGLKVKET